jgi:hypothetical protein
LNFIDGQTVCVNGAGRNLTCCASDADCASLPFSPYCLISYTVAFGDHRTESAACADNPQLGTCVGFTPCHLL